MEDLIYVALVMLKRINPREEMDPPIQVPATTTHTSVQPPTLASPPAHGKQISLAIKPILPPAEPAEPTPQPSEATTVAIDAPEAVPPVVTPSKSKKKKSNKN